VVKSTSENALRNNKRKETGSLRSVAPLVNKRSGNPADAGKRSRVLSKRRSMSRSGPPNAVFLVGFMGAGKSSVGRALERQLNWLFEDLDDRIVQRERRTVAEIFRDSGEPAFRAAEHAALRAALEDLRGGVARIVALGGGAFAQEPNIALLQGAGMPVIFLDAPVEELWRRCRRQANETGAERPLLQSMEQFRKLYNARRKSYSKASFKINTSRRTVDTIAAEIIRKLGLKKIAMRSEQGEAE
jgi:shikimate kinase